MSAPGRRENTQQDDPILESVSGESQRTAWVLLIGDPRGLGEALTKQLTDAGAEVLNANGPDGRVAEALARTNWSAVVILSHDDAYTLRLTLLTAHVAPEIPVWVTLFDRTIINRIREIVPSVNVLTPAEMVADALADLCMPLAERHSGSLRLGFRVVDDALRLMVWSGLGLAAVLAGQTIASVIALHDGIVDAVFFSTRAIATVSDLPRADAAAVWFKLFSTATTIGAVVLVAVFTAALVRRLSRPRLTTLFGRRRAARSGHALLVGFGQIGFRLAQELRRRGMKVLVLERDVNAPCVRLARGAGIPVAIGRGDDRATLEQLGIRTCAVIAAVTSDDLTNVAIGLAATDVRPRMPMVLRLGDGNVAAETESLLHLGSICDAHEIVASSLARSVLEGVGS